MSNNVDESEDWNEVYTGVCSQLEPGITVSYANLYRLYNFVLMRKSIDYIEEKAKEGIATLAASFVPKKSVAELERGHREKDARSTLLLGDCLIYELNGAVQDAKRGFECYREAANLGLPEAVVNFAHMLFIILAQKLGYVEPSDINQLRITKAMLKSRPDVQNLWKDMWHWLEKSAEQGWKSHFLIYQASDADQFKTRRLTETVKQCVNKTGTDSRFALTIIILLFLH
jgi:TPR repeat protein